MPGLDSRVEALESGHETQDARREHEKNETEILEGLYSPCCDLELMLTTVRAR